MRAFSLGSVKQLNKPSRGPRPTAQTPRADDPRALDRAQRAPINRAQPVPVIRDPRAIDVSSRTPAGESYPTSDRHRPDIKTRVAGPRSAARDPCKLLGSLRYRVKNHRFCAEKPARNPRPGVCVPRAWAMFLTNIH